MTPDEAPARASSATLEGRVALVTGASGGIGEGLAVMLAEEGARVALAARRDAALERVASTIRARGGVAISIATDLCGATRRVSM